MDLIKCFGNKPNYPHDPIYHLNFDDHVNIMRDGYLFIASAYEELFTSGDKYSDKEKIFLTFEEPNFCTDKDGTHAKLTTGWGSIESYGEVHQSYSADMVLTLCPYTTMADTTKKRKQVFLPYNERLIENVFNKEFDIIYSGAFPQIDFWGNLMESIKEFKYIDIQYQRGNFKNVTYIEKLKLYSKSKIALCHNTSPIGSRKDRYPEFPNAENNKAFSHLDSGILPQIKYRTIEAAFNKCVILCYKDHWNIIEDYLTPNEDFIYFQSEAEAVDLIRNILTNYSEYTSLAENAYNKMVNNYTVKHFCERFLI